jgi:hypothetical protein
MAGCRLYHAPRPDPQLSFTPPPPPNPHPPHPFLLTTVVFHLFHLLPNSNIPAFCNPFVFSSPLLLTHFPCDGILKQSLGSRNRVGIGLSYRPTRLYIGCRNRFLGIVSCARIFKQSMGARNRVGTGLSYRPARQHWLPESIPWNRILRRKLRSCYGARNQFQKPSLELSSQAT